jgi:Ras-related protein Rab-23
MVEDIEASMKILVVGNGMVLLIYNIFIYIKVGKTSLAQRFAKNIFTNQYKKTLGVDFLMKKKYIKAIDKDVEFMIWDTAGQEYYDAITTRYYRGASGALIVFSVTDKVSFESVRKWRDKVISECDNIPMVLIMNKVDIMEQAVITERQASDLAAELKLPLHKVSVKDNLMVSEVFELLAVEFFNKGM